MNDLKWFFVLHIILFNQGNKYMCDFNTLKNKIYSDFNQFLDKEISEMNNFKGFSFLRVKVNIL